MKLILSIVVLLLFKTSFCAIDKIETLKITDTSIILNQEIELFFPLTVDTLENILGKPRLSKTKTSREANDIFFWDKLGIMVYCPKHTRNVSSFDICFRRSEWRETRRMFKGVVFVKNSNLNKKMSRSDIDEIGFAGTSLTKSVLDNYHTIDFSKVSIIAEFK